MCLDLIHRRVSPGVSPVWTPRIKNSASSLALSHTPSHTHPLQGGSAPPTLSVSALSHQVHLRSSRLTKITWRVRVQVYPSPPDLPLLFSPGFSPSLVLLSLSLPFSFLLLFFPSFFSFSLMCSDAQFPNIAGMFVHSLHCWKCTEAGLGFWVYVALFHPHCIFASLPWQGDATQSFTLLSGFGVFIRKEGKFKTKINPLETLSLRLSHCGIPGWSRNLTYLIFWTWLSRYHPFSQKGGRSFMVPRPAMFWVLKLCALGPWGLLPPTAFSLLTAFLLDHANPHSRLPKGSSQGPGLGLHLLEI